MGFFDELNSFVGEISSIKSDVTNFKKDFVAELHTEAKSVAETIDGTATDLRQTATAMTDTVNQSTSLSSPPPDTADDTSTDE